MSQEEPLIQRKEAVKCKSSELDALNVFPATVWEYICEKADLETLTKLSVVCVVLYEAARKHTIFNKEVFDGYWVLIFGSGPKSSFAVGNLNLVNEQLLGSGMSLSSGAKISAVGCRHRCTIAVNQYFAEALGSVSVGAEVILGDVYHNPKTSKTILRGVFTADYVSGSIMGIRISAEVKPELENQWHKIETLLVANAQYEPPEAFEKSNREWSEQEACSYLKYEYNLTKIIPGNQTRVDLLLGEWKAVIFPSDHKVKIEFQFSIFESNPFSANGCVTQAAQYGKTVAATGSVRMCIDQHGVVGISAAFMWEGLWRSTVMVSIGELDIEEKSFSGQCMYSSGDLQHGTAVCSKNLEANKLDELVC